MIVFPHIIVRSRASEAGSCIRKILGDEAGAEGGGGIAVEPGRGGGGLERRHALRHQARRHARQHVAAAAGGEASAGRCR